MIKIMLITLPIILVIISFLKTPYNKLIDKWKQEIIETEKNFADMLKNEGIHKAFVSYAADDAVLMRDNELIIGKNNIDIFYNNQITTGLSWTPDYIDVAKSGDLAYTYGKYIYTYTDSDGKLLESSGVFHTVWKRQSDGNWKYVWD